MLFQHCHSDLLDSNFASVIMFSSVALQTEFPYLALVATSKSAIEGLTRTLGTEWLFKLGQNMRWTVASHMTSLGVSRLTVLKILNHSESGITAVYDRHSHDREKRAAL